MSVCPCIKYENDERYQLDATILFIIINNSTSFGHLHTHLQEYRGYILLHMVYSTVKENCVLVGGFTLCCSLCCVIVGEGYAVCCIGFRC